MIYKNTFLSFKRGAFASQVIKDFILREMMIQFHTKYVLFFNFYSPENFLSKTV